MSKHQHKPWVWIPTLFATEGVAAATVTYVALLMFVELKASYTTATLMVAALMVPSVAKLFIRWHRKSIRFLHHIILFLHFMLCLAFVGTAFMVMKSKSPLPAFFGVMMVACLNAVNEHASSVYYNQQVPKKMQKFLGNYKFVASQITFIVTYGVLIICVGLHEIVFRSREIAWAMENYLVAGVLILLFLVNCALLQKPNTTMAPKPLAQFHRMNNKKILGRNLRFLFIAAMLLLPQSLLICTRVFFLMAPTNEGGLGCSLQEVGFAQGTIGVIAFLTGIFVGQHLFRKHSDSKMFWTMILPLWLSPLFYFIMTFVDSPNMLHICLMTFASQCCFGLGINIFVVFIQRTTDMLEDNILNLLHSPFVVIAMILPVALSGWLVEHVISLQLFFAINTATALLSIVVVIFNRNFIIRHILFYRNLNH